MYVHLRVIGFHSRKGVKLRHLLRPACSVLTPPRRTNAFGFPHLIVEAIESNAPAVNPLGCVTGFSDKSPKNLLLACKLELRNDNGRSHLAMTRQFAPSLLSTRDSGGGGRSRPLCLSKNNHTSLPVPRVSRSLNSNNRRRPFSTRYLPLISSQLQARHREAHCLVLLRTSTGI